MRLRELFVAIACAGAMLWSPVAAAQDAEPTPVAVPLFQPASQFGPKVVDIVPTDVRLSAAEERALTAALAAQPAFPAYLFSGCHDRAQAAHMLLPAALRPKVMKIWLIAPGRYTAVLPGLIGLRGSGDAAEVSWGHHVALAYRNAAGEVRVVDSALRPGAALSTAEWFALMNLPRMTLWTLTRGDLYLIQGSNLSPATNYASYVWNGQVEEYRQGWIPGNIARDAIGADVAARATCAELAAIRTNPGAMLAFLSNGVFAVPEGCRESVLKFERERAAWALRLGL